jgi:hypothetical protein
VFPFAVGDHRGLAGLVTFSLMSLVDVYALSSGAEADTADRQAVKHSGEGPIVWILGIG